MVRATSFASRRAALLLSLGLLVLIAVVLAACGTETSPTVTPPRSAATATMLPTPTVVAEAPTQLSADSPTPSYLPDIPRISAAELKTRLDRGDKVVVVDVRSRRTYEEGHIPGSIWIELEDLEERMAEIPRDSEVVTYCSWPAEHTSARAAQILQENGYTRVSTLLGGYSGWIDSNFPVEVGAGQ